jgi:hypothetical protein
MASRNEKAVIPSPLISQKIYFVRGTRVMLDADLARLYGVTTSNLNRAVRRNRERFPADFMFQTGKKDQEVLRSQFAISKPHGSGGRRYAA